MKHKPLALEQPLPLASRPGEHLPGPSDWSFELRGTVMYRSAARALPPLMLATPKSNTRELPSFPTMPAFVASCWRSY